MIVVIKKKIYNAGFLPPPIFKVTVNFALPSVLVTAADPSIVKRLIFLTWLFSTFTCPPARVYSALVQVPSEFEFR